MECYIAEYLTGHPYDTIQRRDITAEVVRLREALALAISAFKSGEPLPERCETVLTDVSIGKRQVIAGFEEDE